MEEIFIVDRIENGYAVCETEQGEKKDIPLSGTKGLDGSVLYHVSPIFSPSPRVPIHIFSRLSSEIA